MFGPDRNLYVVNAYFEYSEVLKFKGAPNQDGQHDFAEVFVKRHAEMNPGINHPFNVAFDSNGDLYVSSQNTSLVARYHGPAGKQGQPGLPMPFPQSLDLDRYLPPVLLFRQRSLRQTVSSKSGKRFLHRMAICMSRIVLPIAYGSMRLGPVAFCEISFREAISSINRSICCSVQTAVIFLLEAAVTIQFSDTIFAKTPQASLWHQNPVALMAPREWHSVTTVSFTLPVAIQGRFSVTIPKMVDHPAHSSRISQTTRNF